MTLGHLTGKSLRTPALVCDGGCTKWYHYACVGMPPEQYQVYHEDYS